MVAGEGAGSSPHYENKVNTGVGAAVLKRKSCPKCKTGDLTLERDIYGWYECCIQCGYQRTLVNIVEQEARQLGTARDREATVLSGAGKTG